MNDITKLNCVACRGGEPILTDEQITHLQPQVPEWQIKEVNGEKRLERIFKFRNFSEAIEFTDKVGAAAEEQNHHPLIVTEWGKVMVQWWTHKIGGLHQNDFIMASKTDKLL